MEILKNLGFDWQVALANLINFLIIFFILKKFAFGPIQRVLDDRKAKIDAGLENAKKAETELLMAKEVANKELNIARNEANEIIAAARAQEKAILSQAESKAIKATERLISETEIGLLKERARVEGELKKKTVDLVIAGMEKILPQEIDHQKRAELIKNLTH